jgi:predicted glycoside hydrolase/deacetylase ChbG (UPF0249 family)
MGKRLLVTADDFGMCHAINAGTARVMREGVVRSSNFLVPCPWFHEALERGSVGTTVGRTSEDSCTRQAEQCRHVS